MWHATTASPTNTLLAHSHNRTASNFSRNVRRVFATPQVRHGRILATTLFCSTVDWVMSHCSDAFAVNHANFHITDLNNTADALLLTDDATK